MTSSGKYWINFCNAVAAALLVFLGSPLSAQQQYELNSSWMCRRASLVKPNDGAAISKSSFPLNGWMPATVPGTVLTSLLNNKLIPDPFFGMNNKKIPDIYDVGADYYTYWFVRDFHEPFPATGDKVWLTFRGINYSANVFLNGHKLNEQPDKGMFLRQSYDITPFLAKDGNNRLAVVVYPPDPPGNPNGGQGGDGMIAHNVTNQYVAGWDWIQPVHDRNTGIWDKVFIKHSKQVLLENTHVVTLVPGKRTPGEKQAPAIIKVTTEVENADATTDVEGVVQFEIGGKKQSMKVKLAPQTLEVVEFPPLTLEEPRLWWPNGYGPQNLYNLKAKFLIDGKTVADEEDISVGIREIKAVWNKHTNSREIKVNGQKIFIKGGNRILSDAMLRFSKERFDAEIHYHRDMNLNLIRVWGGGITERPEFYDACDKYGLLVMQDFWVSGDCNGRWYDPLKKEDTIARRKYPDDHGLFLESLVDQVKMLRNHPSLAIWCGGNEIRPPQDILQPFRDSILPALDGTRFFFEYSNDDSMSLHSGDGPYTIQPDTFFWKHRSFPFNSEVGSVGIGDMESLERFIPKKNLVPPYYDRASRKWIVDTVWQYHKYTGYDSAIELYGHPTDAKDFTMKAQLVNYNQYRALMEGASAHMWDWYTGTIIWKTQNPWTAMVGQMYDVYLDPNACLWGTKEGAKPLHIMFDPINDALMVVNNTFEQIRNLKVKAVTYDVDGHATTLTDTVINATSSKSAVVYRLGKKPGTLKNTKADFLRLLLYDSTGQLIDENIYWLPDKNGQYTNLASMKEAGAKATARVNGNGQVDLTITNPGGAPVAFSLHAALIDSNTYERILPVFCDNNYISVFPGETKTIHIQYAPQKNVIPMVDLEGWNFEEQFIEVKQ